MLTSLFRLSGRIDRRTYLSIGIPLMAIKYGVDALAVRLTTGRIWTPFDYVNPSISLREQLHGRLPDGLLLGMAIWALPFLWIGISMTMRRALDAGISPWHCLWFFVPLANWLLIAVLGLVPGKPPPAGLAPADAAEPEDRVRGAMMGILAGVLIVAGTVLFQIGILKSYSAPLFLGTPFTVGMAAGYFYNRRLPRGPRETAAVAALAISLAGAAVLLFALEGALCVAMALPLALAVALPASLLGRFLAIEGPRGWLGPAVAFCALPQAAGFEPRAQPAEREVVSAVEIAAPPERVWKHVVAFADLPPPSELVFRLGIAYPIRARIEGSGRGAIRRCEFSTGAFVEPITIWDAPRRLAFDVRSQPPPMTEWSPYRHVHPPHLEGTMRSRRGEFRLVALPGGRTRLEGSTWYTLEMGPQLYWAPFADALVRSIHLRVLQHIAEASG